MKSPGAPIRFLALLLGCWTAGRCYVLFGDRLLSTDPAYAQSITLPPAVPHPGQRWARKLIVALERLPGKVLHLPEADTAVTVLLPPTRTEPPVELATRHPSRAPIEPSFITRSPNVASRLSGTAWIFLRPGMGGSLADAGQLGGSQAGARIRWRLNRGPETRTALTARLSTDLRGIQGAELATGVEWHPLANLPLWVAAERRFALGPGGRNAFSAYAAGGIWKPGLPGKLTLDGYGQAGVVGLRHRDLFVDGAVRLSRPVRTGSELRVGAGVWGAAQPGVSRLDVGPFVSLPVKLGKHRVPLSLEGRLRVAGNALPGSGVAVTMASDF